MGKNTQIVATTKKRPAQTALSKTDGDKKDAQPQPKKRVVITSGDIKTTKDARDLFLTFCLAQEREWIDSQREPTSMFRSVDDVNIGPAKAHVV